MRITLITGFLGAGKTTFLRRFISDHSASSRIGVIINDLSQLEVDGELVRMGDLVSEKMALSLAFVRVPSPASGVGNFWQYSSR